MTGWFPGTKPVRFSRIHARYLAYLLEKGTVLHRDIAVALKISKTTAHDVKDDLIRLGWCREIEIGSAREVRVKISREKEIACFLSRSRFLKQCILLRPHRIVIRVLCRAEHGGFQRACETLQRKHNVLRTSLRNNAKCVIRLEVGTLVLHQHGRSMDIFISDFILPLLPEDLPDAEDYILQGIADRLKILTDFIRAELGRFRITMRSCTVLKSLELGIIMERDAASALDIACELERLGLFKDKSVRGCDEWEKRGRFEAVVEPIIKAASLIAEKRINLG